MIHFEQLLFVSFLLPVLEIILQNTFYKPLFSLGIPLFEKTISIPSYNFPRRYNETYTQDEAKFRFDENLVYFQSRMHQFRMFRSNSSIPFRGIGEIKPDNTIHIVARAPIGFLIFGILFIMLFYLNSGEFGDSTTISDNLFIIILGIVAVGAGLTFSYFIEKKRFQKSCDELVYLINELDKNVKQ